MSPSNFEGEEVEGGARDTGGEVTKDPSLVKVTLARISQPLVSDVVDF